LYYSFVKKQMNKVYIRQSWPQAFQAMQNFSIVVRPVSIQPLQAELLKIRVSQINRCAYCLDMHTRAARRLGESQQRLDIIAAWRATDIFTPEEKAILGKAEQLRLLDRNPFQDESIYQLSADQEKEVVMLTTVINAWNRIMQGISPEVNESASNH
jgi:AhpD family alkylhydroperoxidase